MQARVDAVRTSVEGMLAEFDTKTMRPLQVCRLLRGCALVCPAATPGALAARVRARTLRLLRARTAGRGNSAACAAQGADMWHLLRLRCAEASLPLQRQVRRRGRQRPGIPAVVRISRRGRAGARRSSPQHVAQTLRSLQACTGKVTAAEHAMNAELGQLQVRLAAGGALPLR